MYIDIGPYIDIQAHLLDERCDKACVILRLTDDGDNLDVRDLALIEHAVNGTHGTLSKEGYALFEDLYQRVTSETYVKPWFHDIEHMTIDSQGFVCWKEQKIEHFLLSWAWSSEAKETLTELAERCRQLEARGVRVNTGSVIWNWPNSLKGA